jgi:hypothetical protein
MLIELVLLFVFAVAVGVAVVKVIEWRLDVLYGPYLAPRARGTKTAPIDELLIVRVWERDVIPRFVFAAYSIAFAVAVIFAIVTTVKHLPGARAGAAAARVG